MKTKKIRIVKKGNSEHLVIKPEDLSVRNEMHFEVQRNTRMSIFRSKKGKGSFRRRPKHRGVDE